MKNVNSWNLLSRGLDLIAYISLDDVHWMVLLKLIFVTFISYLQYNFGQIFLWMIITLPTRQNYVTAWSFAWPIFFETPSNNGGRVLTKSGLAIYAPFGLIKLCRICQSGRFDWCRFSPGEAKLAIEADSTILFQDSCVGWLGLILPHWLALVGSPLDLLGARIGPSRPAL